MASNCLTPPKHNQNFSDVQKRIHPSNLGVNSRCSARHVDYENSAQCRFAYATWCPVCEEEERNKRGVDITSRRRSKSEGMEVERNDVFYSKSPITKPVCEKSSRTTTLIDDHQISRQMLNNHNNHEALRYFTVAKQGDIFNSRRHLSSRSLLEHKLNYDKVMKPVHQPCENHVEPNRLYYEAWDRLTSDQNQTFHQKESHTGIPLHERYYYEVEILRSKINELRDISVFDKRSPEYVEPERVPQFNLEPGLKRPRDISPSALPSSTSRKLPAVPLSKASRSKSALLPRDPSITSGLFSSSSATSISSDSEFNDSGCEEEDLKDGSEIECEEDDSPLSASCTANFKPLKSSPHCTNTDLIEDKVGGDHVSIDPGKLHPALRASLFSHVPPYIRFSTHDVQGSALPATISKLLKWKLSTITPLVVRKTVVNSNFKLVRKSNEWCGTWGKHMKSICFKTLREYQKINHFPGTFQIGRKDRLWKNLFRLMAKFGKKEFGFIPRTYVLPQDSKLLRSAWEKNCGKERWIVKPPASARGTGIKVIHKWTQIPKKCPLVVQKYIADPFLINGSKFDLRLYVLVSSINPLRIYIYDNGLVRFASVKYSNDMTSLADRYMHLTNYSINKLSSQYTQNEDAEACQGHKWSLQAMWNYMEEQGVDVKLLWEQLVDLVIKTVISGESAITQMSQANLASRYCSYELFGVDVLLDQNLKPWLLEVNISPSLHSSSPLDLAVKGPLVQDLMNMAGYQIPAKLSSEAQSELGESVGLQAGEGLCYDRRLYTTALSCEERNKHSRYEQCESREDYLDTVLQDLTPDDVRHLVQYEDELTQIGNFQKIFPTTETHSYHQFFEAPRYYNMLFDAWEVEQNKDRSKGIARLQSLCQKQVHLDITQIPRKRTKVCTSQSGSELASPEAEEAQLRDIPQPNPPSPDKSKTSSLNVGTIWRAVRSRSGRPGLITKPYPRSAYIARRAIKTPHPPSSLS